MPWRNVKGSNESAEKISLLRKKSKASSDANTNHTFDVVIASSLPALFAASRDVPHEMENDVRDDVCLLTKPFNQSFYWLFVMVQQQILQTIMSGRSGRRKA